MTNVRLCVHYCIIIRINERHDIMRRDQVRQNTIFASVREVFMKC